MIRKKVMLVITVTTLFNNTVMAQKHKSVLNSKDIAQGEALINKSDCSSCHQLNDRFIGPGYAEIAKKYKPTPANIEYLSNKIIKGGKGIWGTTPMAPHPVLTKAESKKIVNYILTVK